MRSREEVVCDLRTIGTDNPPPVKDTGLANLDARVLQTTTEVSANLVRKMKLTSATFDVDEFLVHVGAALGLDKQQPEDVDADDNSDSDIDELEDEAEATQRRQERVAARGRRGGVLGDWAKIGWMAAGLYRRVPGVEFMYGPVSVQHTKRTVARRRARADLAPETRPQEVDTQDPKKNKDITLQNTIQIVKVLSRIDPERKGVNYFRLLVNPHDFGQTVENIFYASFLVRDGKMGIEVNEDDGEVVARLMEPADPEVDGDVPKNQTIIELDMEAWDEAIKLFGITESAIPNRAPAQTQVGSSGWYGA